MIETELTKPQTINYIHTKTFKVLSDYFQNKLQNRR